MSTQTYTQKAIGPRVVGGTYRCGYWRETYEVLAINTTTAPEWMGWSMTVRWSDGRVTTHCTAWDRHDSIVQA